MDQKTLSTEFTVIALLLAISYTLTLVLFQTIQLWQHIAYPLVAIFVLLRLTQSLHRIADALEA